MRTTVYAMAVGAVVGVMVQGCGAPSDDETATATTTSALQVQAQAGITDGVIDADGTLAPEPDVAAKKVADHPLKNLYPEGCATKTLAGNVVTLKLDKCSGPFGKVVLEGDLVATFTKTTEEVLHVEIAAADGMKANGGPLAYGAAIDIAYEGSSRKLTYRGHSNGTTERGVTYQRHTQLVITSDVVTKCGQIDGVSQGSIGKYEIDLSVEGLKGCKHQCPTGGVARATVDGPLIKDASITVSFDGSDAAHVEIDARKKRSLDVDMDCEAGEAR